MATFQIAGSALNTTATATTTAPLVVLFERDDTIAVPLLSQIRLAQYDVCAARTPVELFDTLSKQEVALVLVDLGNATAGRREFWVALDAQRRGQSTQILTFRYTPPGSIFDTDFEPSARAIADIEVSSANEFEQMISAIRQRVPLTGGSPAPAQGPFGSGALGPLPQQSPFASASPSNPFATSTPSNPFAGPAAMPSNPFAASPAAPAGFVVPPALGYYSPPPASPISDPFAASPPFPQAGLGAPWSPQAPVPPPPALAASASPFANPASVNPFAPAGADASPFAPAVSAPPVAPSADASPFAQPLSANPFAGEVPAPGPTARMPVPPANPRSPVAPASPTAAPAAGLGDFEQRAAKLSEMYASQFGLQSPAGAQGSMPAQAPAAPLGGASPGGWEQTASFGGAFSQSDPGGLSSLPAFGASDHRGAREPIADAWTPPDADPDILAELDAELDGQTGVVPEMAYRPISDPSERMPTVAVNPISSAPTPAPDPLPHAAADDNWLTSEPEISHVPTSVALQPTSPAPVVSRLPTLHNEPAERALGNVLVEGALLSPEKLDALRGIQRLLADVNMDFRLGELALHFQFLSPDQLLAAMLVSRGLVSPQQIAGLGRAKQDLARSGMDYDLEQLLVKFHILPAEQIHALRAELG
ncbi:MAG TPA: hypothetical protein VFU88_01690 [Ktedonobacterales bacterium]|nr:hypothetical protein [Ktedonobacterales bacterium]